MRPRLRPEVIPNMITTGQNNLRCWFLLFLCSLGSLCAVLGTGLHTSGHALCIESASDDVVTDTGKVLDTAAADHNNAVLLKIVADTGNVCGDFIAVGQADTGDLTQCGVRLLGGGGTDCGADASLLRRAEIGLAVLQSVQSLLHCGGGGLVGNLLSAFSYQLVKRRQNSLLLSSKIPWFSRSVSGKAQFGRS